LYFDAFKAPLNKNCTLSSYGFKETIHKTKGFEQTATCALTDHTSEKCWKIKYPTTFPGVLTYDLIVKYSSVNTKKVVWIDTLPGKIDVKCDGPKCVPKVLAPVPVATVSTPNQVQMAHWVLIGVLIFFGFLCFILLFCYCKMRMDKEELDEIKEYKPK